MIPLDLLLAFGSGEFVRFSLASDSDGRAALSHCGDCSGLDPGKDTGERP